MVEGQDIDTESKGVKRKHGDLEVEQVESLDESLSTASIHGAISSCLQSKRGVRVTILMAV